MREKLLILSDEDTSIQLALKIWEDKAFKVLGAVHRRRIREWSLARFALQQGLHELGYEFSTDCHFIGHQKIAEIPGVSFSLSHTDGYGGAWIRESSAPLGLDIERKSRQVQAGIREKLLHPDDMDLTTLELWTGKEAVYKCLPTELQDKIWLSRIALQEKVFFAGDFTGLWSIENQGEILIGKATLIADE